MERPILFSSEMVRAILRVENPKTQTRRVAKDQGAGVQYQYVENNPTFPETWKGKKAEPYTGWVVKYPDLALWLPRKCPYGKAGDRLWVRETFVVESNRHLDSEENYPPPFSDGRPIKRVDDVDYGCYWEQCHYCATDPKPDLVNQNTDEECGWSPSIHMPRWASRINLEAVSVRVERIQGIRTRDIIAEGVCEDESYLGSANRFRHPFIALWDSINEQRGFGWDKNPWVWCVEFKRIGGN